MKSIVLINGKKRHGKDYVASIINTYLNSKGVKSEIMSFADPLKKVIAGTFDISLEELDDYKNIPTMYPVFITQTEETIRQIDFRYILQRFGTEGMKPVFGADVWTKLLYTKAQESENDIIIVPDFRFMIEYRPLNDYNLFSISIQNGNILPVQDQHSSETELDECNFIFDATIDNSVFNDETYIIDQFKQLERYIYKTLS